MKNYFKKGAQAFVAVACCAAILGGCGDDPDDFVFTGPVVPPPPPVAAPVAVDDTETVLGQASNDVSAPGVLANDTINGATVTAFDSTSANGGTVVVNNDGSFSYNAPAGFRGTDRFEYTLGNAGGTSTATVTLNVNDLAFFVDNTASAGGDGTESDPFDALNDAITDPDLQSGDTIFVFRGDGTSLNQSGAFVLPNGVDLIGEGEGLALQTVVPPGPQAVIEGPVTLSGDNTIAGFLIANSTGNSITATGANDLTIRNNTFRTPDQRYLELINVSGTLSVTMNTFDQQDVDNFEYIAILNSSTDGTFEINDNIFTDDNLNDPGEAVTIEVFGTSIVSIEAMGNSFTSPDDVTVGGSWDTAFCIETANITSTTLNIVDNTFTNSASGGPGPQGDAISILLDDSSVVDGVISSNVVNASPASNRSVTNNGFEVFVEGSSLIPARATLSVIGNEISNPGDGVFNSGILLFASDDGQLEATVDGNSITGSDDRGISVAAAGSTSIDSQIVTFILNNTISGSVGISVFHEIQATGLGEICADLENNTVGSGLFFSDGNNNNEIDVEEFSTLSTDNNGATVAGTDAIPGDVTDVPDGTCATVFP